MQYCLNYSGTRFLPLTIKITQFSGGFRLNSRRTWLQCIARLYRSLINKSFFYTWWSWRFQSLKNAVLIPNSLTLNTSTKCLVLSSRDSFKTYLLVMVSASGVWNKAIFPIKVYGNNNTMTALSINKHLTSTEWRWVWYKNYAVWGGCYRPRWLTPTATGK